MVCSCFKKSSKIKSRLISSSYFKTIEENETEIIWNNMFMDQKELLNI